eukprot:6928001-Alexandrium_andersonii.AAC.1
MSASLVGSEMCIRDSAGLVRDSGALPGAVGRQAVQGATPASSRTPLHSSCLLYTSDAADDM